LAALAAWFALSPEGKLVSENGILRILEARWLKNRIKTSLLSIS
jgi:hypothetical protein